jgi:hypothetical protein
VSNNKIHLTMGEGEAEPADGPNGSGVAHRAHIVETVQVKEVKARWT